MEQYDIEKLLLEGKAIQVKPQGWSMYPMLVPGRDEARIAPLPGRRLRRGDVVLYRRRKTPEWNSKIRTSTPEGAILVLHRIWRVRGDTVYLVGDNQKLVEGPLDREQMRGILTGFVRKGRYVPVTNLLYRLYAFLWLLLRPFRPVLSHMAAALRKH